MFKLIFTKLNNFIQWTKKWHFFHFFVSGAALLTLFFAVVLVMFIITYLNDPYSIRINAKNSCNGDVSALIAFSEYAFATLCTGIIGIFINVFCILKHLIYRKNCCITSKLLLCNKYYNIYYIIFFILTIVSWIICFILHFFFA